MERADSRQLQQRAQLPQPGNVNAGPPTTRRGQPAITAGPLALQDVPRSAAPASRDEESEDEDDEGDEQEKDDENSTSSEDSDDDDDEDDDEPEIKEPTLIRIAVHVVLLQ